MNIEMGDFRIISEDGHYELSAAEDGKWRSLGVHPRFGYAFLEMITQLQASAISNGKHTYGVEAEWLTKLGALREIERTSSLLEGSL